jgi:hypothetical protein
MLHAIKRYFRLTLPLVIELPVPSYVIELPVPSYVIE